MRTATFDFSPLFRSSVGFDRIFDLLERASNIEPIDNWPPYDIVKTGDDSYEVRMAVAGFMPDELDLTYEPNLLVVSGSKAAEDKGDYVHRGIATRSFARRFELADHVEVANASLDNGLLVIRLKREIPEEMKPRKIAVTLADALPASGEMKQIETQKQAA